MRLRSRTSAVKTLRVFAPSRELSLLLSTKATRLPTKLATKFRKALKGRNISAQGNALGNGAKND
jgi:hypothetical protein